jgi:TM2 domain-containing membrane protein YozV
MKELLISVLLTLFLGPGMGHLYLKQFKKAWILIGLTIVSAVIFVIHALKGLKPEQIIAIQADPGAFTRSITTGKSGPSLVFDIFFAAIWAYALVDGYIICRRKNIVPPPDVQDTGHTI